MFGSRRNHHQGAVLGLAKTIIVVLAKHCGSCVNRNMSEQVL
jgi:hypothetical protein